MRAVAFLIPVLASFVASAACADEIVTVPPRCSILSIHAKLNRAENSYVTFATNRQGRWFDDGRTKTLENQGATDYTPKSPKLFAPSSRPYKIRVGGRFSVGRWLPWVKSDEDNHPVVTYPDRAVVHLYGGKREPSNTDVTITWGGKGCVGSGPKNGE